MQQEKTMRKSTKLALAFVALAGAVGTTTSGHASCLRPVLGDVLTEKEGFEPSMEEFTPITP